MLLVVRLAVVEVGRSDIDISCRGALLVVLVVVVVAVAGIAGRVLLSPKGGLLHDGYVFYTLVRQSIRDLIIFTENMGHFPYNPRL